MPTGHLRHFIEHYFAPHPSTELREMFFATAILDFATASVMVFEPIYLYSVGFSITQILYFFIALYVLYFFLLPLGGRICRGHGYEHSILYSSPFLIIYYLSLFATRFDRRFILAALFALAIQKILYWPGYHSNFATYGDGKEVGREVSNRYTMASLASALAPLVGSLIIARSGFASLFIFVSILILLSNLPMMKTPELFVPKDFPYVDAVKRVFERGNARKFFAFFGYGEELVALVLWPIFISLMVKDFVYVGTIVSLSMFVTILVTLYVGRLSDEGNRTAVLRTGTIYTAASWFVRPIVTGGFGAFLTDLFYRVAKNTMSVPQVAMIYDDARKNHVMRTVIFFEMSLALGKVAAALLAVAACWYLKNPWIAIFIIAGVFSSLFSLLKDPK